MLSQIEPNATVSQNVASAFRELHTRKVYHGDVRAENILVRPDYSVVLIDFERSITNADEELLNDEVNEVKSLLASL